MVYCTSLTINTRYNLHCRYEWLFYINPNYFGYSAMMFVFLEELDGDRLQRKQRLEGCDFESWLECFPNSGRQYLAKFGFMEVEPYFNFLVSVLECSWFGSDKLKSNQ